MANLNEVFSTDLGETVYKFEWKIYLEGGPMPIRGVPKNGLEAHDRLMSAQEYLCLE